MHYRSSVVSSRRVATAVALVLAAAARSASEDNSSDSLDEVVVTASRRAQSVIDVPYNISVVSGKDIASAGLTDLQSLERIVPGLVIPDVGSRGNSVNSNIVLRGMSANDPTGGFVLPYASVPLVSTYVDDVAMFANFRLTDIAQVEVLRGPQGTLYGSGAVAGTIRLMHNLPDPKAFAAQVGVDGSKTSHAEDDSYSLTGMLNAPLSSDIALRFSAAYDQTAGFTRAPKTMVLDSRGDPVLANPSDPLHSSAVFGSAGIIDNATTGTARASLLWNISDITNIQLAYQHQRNTSDGFSAETPGYHYEFLQMWPRQPYTSDIDLGSLTGSSDLGFATITSATSYYVTKTSSTFDASAAIEYFDQAYLLYGGYPRLVGPTDSDTREAAVAEELRLVSRPGSPVDYVAGAFFRHEYDSMDQIQFLPGISAWSELPGSAAAVNAAYGTNYATFGDFQQYAIGAARPSAIVPTDANYFYNRSDSFLDRAVYGELTWHVTSAWQVTGGARMFWQALNQYLRQSLPYGGAAYSTLTPPDDYGTGIATANPSYRQHIGKLNTSYELNAFTRVYATWSEGFRHGGANAVPVGACPLCESQNVVPYKSDSAKNYEVGIKGTTPEKRFRYSADVYRVDWSDIQLQTFGTAGEPIVVNAGNARSQGVEIEVNANLSVHWAGTLGYNYTDAKLTSVNEIIDKGIPLIGAPVGTRLPNAPKQLATAAVEFTQPLGQDRIFTLRVDASYRSDVYAALPTSATTPAVHLGGFVNTSASASVKWTSHLATRLYINNISNGEHIAAESQYPSYLDQRYTYAYPGRPRTVGIHLDYTF